MSRIYNGNGILRQEGSALTIQFEISGLALARFEQLKALLEGDKS